MKRFAALFAVFLWSDAATAGEITHAYTTYDIGKCTRTAAEAEESFGAFTCPGYKGYDIYWAEGDLRTFVAYGRNGFEHCSAQQTFGRFNTINTTVEWRLESGKPFAAIQRWNVSDNDDNTKIKSWLGVTRIENGNSCRVALVEGSLPRANAKAREAADRMARDFNCQTGLVEVIGATPMQAENLMSGTPCGVE
ncbi:MAG: hypothetical protein H7X89_15190 [Rhizobiales bacterium]|nr:hypothetical protein [Hyphomicrobiales bacterium]